MKYFLGVCYEHKLASLLFFTPKETKAQNAPSLSL